MTTGRTIHILRHAHSSWAIPGQRDHQRVLDDRGRADAARLAGQAADLAARVERVVCSTAVRARQTLELIRRALPGNVEIRFSDDLYALGSAAYEAEIASFEGPGEILLVGHNPTIEQLVCGLCADDPQSMCLVRPGVGTANWLTIGLASGSPMRGVLHHFVRP